MIVVVTARCIDLASSRYDTDKIKCDTCGEMTWISSSWRGKKIDRIICERCFNNEKFGEFKDCDINVTKENIKEFIEWARDYYKLPWWLTDKEIINQSLKFLEKKIGKKIKIMVETEDKIDKK